MLGDSRTETWFGNIWKNTLWEPEKPVLGIMAFEISRLMSKVVNIWQCLTDRQIARLKEEVTNSVGIQKLVSEDEDYLMDLALAEILTNLGSVVTSVVVLGKKCTDPTYHNLQNAFVDLDAIDPKWYGWQYRLKKMEKKVKKMEKFVATTEQLYSEIEVLADLEQTLKRMRAGASSGKVRLLEFQEKVVWQRQQVKYLQEVSPWGRTYDYVARLILRSIFTIVERIKFIHGVNQMEPGGESSNHNSLSRSNSMCPHFETEIYSSESDAHRAPVRRSFSNLSSNLGFVDERSKFKNRKSFDQSPSSILCRKQHLSKVRRFAPIGLTGCVTGGIESPFIDAHSSPSGSSFRSNAPSGSSFRSNATFPKDPDDIKDMSSPRTPFFASKRRLINASPSTLGHAALALHYANVILLIEKLVSAPHLISLDARDDLYNMLPSAIRSCLREKLKTFSKSPASAVFDAAFAAEWGLAIGRILEWLSPLAHNMVRWQSDRNFERRRLAFGSSVLLIHTLYFARRAETEAAIVELLMGLNYLFRFSREINERPFRESTCSRALDGPLFPKYNMLID